MQLLQVALHMNTLLPQVSKKYVSKELAKEIHGKAEPFIKWLKEAEEESEGSEEEEEEDEDNVEVRNWVLFRFVVCRTIILSNLKNTGIGTIF